MRETGVLENLERRTDKNLRLAIASLVEVAKALIERNPNGALDAADKGRSILSQDGQHNPELVRYDIMVTALRHHFIGGRERPITQQQRKELIIATAPVRLANLAYGPTRLEEHIVAALLEYHLEKEPQTAPWIAVNRDFGTHFTTEYSGPGLVELLNSQQVSQNPVERVMASYMLSKVRA